MDKKTSGVTLPLTTLLVDDHPLVLTAESCLLTQFGFHVVKASSAKEALEILKHSPVDLVITDIEMPEMRGDELAYEIHKKYPNLPVIAATAGNIVELAINEKAGFHKILSKPLTREKLSFFSFKQQKKRCVVPTKVKAIDGPNGRRIFLGSAFPGVYLTPREAELAIFVSDYSYREIAGIMSVSSRTTEYYAANIKKKLHCTNKRNLIHALNETGIVEQLKKLSDFRHLFDEVVLV